MYVNIRVYVHIDAECIVYAPHVRPRHSASIATTTTIARRSLARVDRPRVDRARRPRARPRATADGRRGRAGVDATFDWISAAPRSGRTTTPVASRAIDLTPRVRVETVTFARRRRTRARGGERDRDADVRGGIDLDAARVFGSTRTAGGTRTGAVRVRASRVAERDDGEWIVERDSSGR